MPLAQGSYYNQEAFAFLFGYMNIHVLCLRLLLEPRAVFFFFKVLFSLFFFTKALFDLFFSWRDPQCLGLAGLGKKAFFSRRFWL